MRKRFNVFWRIAVVLLVVASVVSVVVTSDTTQAAGARTQRPNTYMDPIPARISDAIAFTGGWISGTTLEGATGAGYDVVDVEVMIKRNVDGWCWDDGGGGWLAVDEWWNPVGGIAPEPWTTDQWVFGFPPAALYNPSFAAGDLVAGWSYTVYSRAVDFDGYEDLTPASDTFIYDDEPPDVSFETNLPMTSAPLTRIYSLTEIKGNAHDDCGDTEGVIQQVRLAILDSDNSVWWNGFFWQPDAVWIKAQLTKSGDEYDWSISSTTNPPLPEWQHNFPADTGYLVWVQASDNADNRDFDPVDLTAPGYNFLYRKQLTSAGCYLDPLPAYANSLVGPPDPSYWRFMDIGFTGTARALPLQDIVEVAVEIKDVTSNVFWDDTAGDWAGSVDWPDCPTVALVFPADYDALSGQWDWIVPIPGALTWQQGHSYQIQARATDDSATAKSYISSTDSFIFDDLLPYSSNIYPFDDVVYNVWNSLTGNCEDDGTLPNSGKIAAEVVLIQRTSDLLFWNGFSWGDDEWNSGSFPDGEWDWMYATASGGAFGQNTHVEWKVTATTAYPLPPMVNNEEYTITAMSFDRAGNEETTATKTFTFYMDLSGYTPPATTVPTSTGGPTSTAVPTNTSTTVPTSPPSKTKTPTYTAPPVATATATTVPAGFSGSGTVGASGGTVTAKDGTGDTSVTASFDAGAFDSNTAVTISGSGNCNAVGTAPSGYSKGTSCFTMTPAGDLDADVEICVYYTSADKSAAGGDADNLVLAYKDASGKWVILDTTVDEGTGTICADTDYIGTFAVLGETAAEEGGEWEWWYYLLIGLGALLVIAIIILILVRPKGEGEGAGEGAAEEGYEEEEEI